MFLKRAFVLVALLFLPLPAQADDAPPIPSATFVCVPKLNPARQHLPPGKQLKDLCKAGEIALLFPGPVSPRPGAVIHPTSFVCFPQPLEPPRPIPPGKEKNFDDLCPPGGTAWLFPGPASKPTGPVPPQPDSSKKTP
jgi:hypothetical protein